MANAKVRFTGIQQLRSFLKIALGPEYSCIKVKPSKSGKTLNIEAYSSDPTKGSRGPKPYYHNVRINAETDVDTMINYLTRSINGKL